MKNKTSIDKLDLIFLIIRSLGILSFTFVLSSCSTAGVQAYRGSGAVAAHRLETSGWADGKAVRDVNAEFSQVVQAATQALEALRLNITKTDIAQDRAEIIGEYLDSRTIWIDLRSNSGHSTHLEIRVSVQGNKEASYRIMEKIQSFLEKS